MPVGRVRVAFGAVLVVSLLVLGAVVAGSEPAREQLDRDFGFIGPAPVFAAAAVAIVLSWPTVHWWTRTRTCSCVVLVVAAALAVVTSVGTAVEDNWAQSFPTRAPAERGLQDRVRLDSNGRLSERWPAFAELADVVPGPIIVPPDSFWAAYLREVGDREIVVEEYEFALDRTPLRFRDEWIYDSVIGDGVRLVVVGRGSTYRLFEGEGFVALLVEDPV